jgi:hypothetical protein
MSKNDTKKKKKKIIYVDEWHELITSKKIMSRTKKICMSFENKLTKSSDEKNRSYLTFKLLKLLLQQFE